MQNSTFLTMKILNLEKEENGVKIDMKITKRFYFYHHLLEIMGVRILTATRICHIILIVARGATVLALPLSMSPRSSGTPPHGMQQELLDADAEF